MRPAFASVLGQSGAEMVERDRADHAGGRDMLLKIMGELEGVGGEHEAETRRVKLETVARMVMEAFDELGEHMKVESGEVLPHFETVISRDMSVKLAREYADTLVMTPDLTTRAHDNTGDSREAAFTGGVNQYIHTSPAQFRQLYASILEGTSNEGEKLWFDEAAKRELEKIQVHKGQKPKTTVEPEQSKGQKETSTMKVPVNALGLPVSWDHLKKAKL